MNWMKHLSIYFLISALVIIPGIYSLVRFGFKPSIEFTGGTRLTLEKHQHHPNRSFRVFKDYSPSLEDSSTAPSP